MSDFKREERYIVVKLKDIDQEETEALREFIQSWQIPTRECVVVEPDWPNYEDTWQAIEDVANGKYKSPYELIEQQQARIDELKQDREKSGKDYCALMERYDVLQQERDELAAVVERLRDSHDELQANSVGVIGLHMNGDTATWDSLRQGGRFESWLMAFDETPRQNLNAVKLNALLDFRHDCGSMNGYNAVDVWDKMDEYIKREFG